MLVKGNLQQLVLSSDIERLVGLEGCLSGNVPTAALASEGGVDGPCGQLARAKTVKVVFGPGTFLNEAAEQIDEQLTSQTTAGRSPGQAGRKLVNHAALARGLPASQARTLGQQANKVTLGRFQENLVTLALEYGLTCAAQHRRRELRLERSCSTRPSPSALPSRASPICSRALTQRWYRCG